MKAREQNRIDFPKCAAFIESMTETFGADNVTVRFVSENGKTKGRLRPAGEI
jgi:hypothetical protein